MGRGAWRVRALLAVLAGGLVVHELRYRSVGVEADQAAHGYMPWLQLVGGVLVLAGVVEFAVRLARLVDRGPDVRGEPPRARVLWPVLSVILLVVVGGQEAAEIRWLGAHDHELLGALLAHGGWLIVPLSVLVGGLCALVLRGVAVLARAIAHDAAVPAQRGARHDRRGIRVASRWPCARAPFGWTRPAAPGRQLI